MLLNITFKRIVDFHGHLCPDLVIGCKFCEYARKLLSASGDFKGGLTVVAENSTSALDAIQIMLGVTMGNRRLQVMDHGKHVYKLYSKQAGAGFRFSLKPLNFGDDAEYDQFEQCMENDQAALEDVVEFQKMMDKRVREIMSRNAEDLFTVTPLPPVRLSVETPSIYLTCSRCGEQVIRVMKIEYQGETCCMPCFLSISPDSMYRSIQ